jgi:hypothetical protein
MAVYDKKNPPFTLDEDYVSINGAATGEYGVSSSSGLYVTKIMQKAVYGTLFAVMHLGAGNTGIVQVDDDGVLRLVVAGGLALSTATGQALVDTSSGNSSTTDNKLNIGWFTDAAGDKYLAICNRLDSTSVAADKLKVARVA